MIRRGGDRLARVWAWCHTRFGRWMAMLLVFVAVAALFHVLFLLLGGVIGAVTLGSPATTPCWFPAI